MKKILSLLLVLVLAVTLLPLGALAEGPSVVLSPQNLRVDGKRIDCEKYNIDGSNYFKLRDIAYLVSGTGSQFSVGWDGEKNVIRVVTGEAYEPNGSELDLSGGDKSESARPSTQTLLINGVERGDLSAYNIGGNNYFKLRDLGEALGFRVDYDKPSNTAIVVSRTWSRPVEWLTEETIFNQDGAAFSHSVDTYNEDGRMLSHLFEDEESRQYEAYSYDELGRVTEYRSDYVSSYDGETYENHSVTRYEYDIWGNLVHEVYEAVGDVVSETNYTYDDNGNVLVVTFLNNAGTGAYYYTYDDNGYEIKYVSTYEDEVLYTEEYIRGEDGSILESREIDGNGEVTSVTQNIYEDGRLTEEHTTSGDYWYNAYYTYDDAGNVIRLNTDTPYGLSTYTTIYDEAGRPVQEELVSGDYNSITVRSYDEAGNLLRSEYTTSDGSYSLQEYTYDEDGNVLTDVYSGVGYSRTATYTYDSAARKMTCLVLLEYYGVG